MSFVQPSPIFPGAHADSHVEKHEAKKAEQKQLAATEAKIQEATHVAENRARQQINENRVLTAKFIHQLKEDLKSAFQLSDKQANEVIRNSILIKDPAPPGANDPHVQAVVREEGAEQAKQQQTSQQKSQADSQKPQSGPTDASQSPSAQYVQMLRGTKSILPSQQAQQAQTQTNQQPQTLAQQEPPQSQPQQTPQPQVANQSLLKGQPGLPEQPLGQPQPPLANAQQQPGQINKGQQPGQLGTSQAQPAANQQAGIGQTGKPAAGDGGETLPPDVHVFNYGPPPASGTGDPEAIQQALKMQVLAQMMFRGGVPQPRSPLPTKSDSGQTVSDIRRDSKKGDIGTRGNGEGKAAKSAGENRRLVALNLRRDMGFC